MINNCRVLAVIPARGGSKGIPRKNLYPICGIPLIGYVCSAVKKSQYVDTVIVSTDSDEIAHYAYSQGVEVPFMRPQELASDTASTSSVIHHALTFYAQKGIYYDIVVTLQPTQPLIQSWHIDEALLQMYTLDASIVGVSPHDMHPILLRTMREDKSLQPVLPHRSSTLRRQEMESIYCVNGMIYINKGQEILDNPNISLNDNIYGYEISSLYYVDIDTLDDVTICIEKIKALNIVI